MAFAAQKHVPRYVVREQMPSQQRAHRSLRIKLVAFLVPAIGLAVRVLVTPIGESGGQMDSNLLVQRSLEVLRRASTRKVNPRIAYVRQIQYDGEENVKINRTNILRIPTGRPMLDNGYEERIPFLSREENMYRWEETGDCKYRDWQKRSYPTCNNVHEYFSQPKDLATVAVGGESIIIGQEPLKSQQVFLKAGRWSGTSFTESTYYHRQLDATIMEHLTSSPYVMSIHGFCSTSVLTPRAGEGGDLYGLINSVRNGGKDLTSLDKLRVAIQLAEGVAAMHEAGVAHNDLDVSQRLFVGGQYRLNDFTYGILIPTNSKTNEACKSTRSDLALDPWKYKSPEYLAWCYPEMPHDPIRIDMAEIYSLGTEMYHLLTSSLMWEGELDKEKCKQLIFIGSRPPIPGRIARSTDAATQSIISTLNACWRHRPEDRPSAKQVVRYLRRDLSAITNGTEGGGGSLVTVKLPPIKEARENEEVCYYRFMTLPGRNDRGSDCDNSWFDAFKNGMVRPAN